MAPNAQRVGMNMFAKARATSTEAQHDRLSFFRRDRRKRRRGVSDRPFDRIRLTDATVYKMLASGHSLEEIIVALVSEKEHAMQRIINLEGIAPRKIVLPDGRVAVWHCPDEFVPELVVSEEKR